MITEEELAYALEEQRATGNRLGEILVARGAISRLELASALADQWASLQKLRPPEPVPGNGRLRGASDEPAPGGPLGAAETERVDALEARLAEP